MFQKQQASIAVFGYRQPLEADFSEIVHAIDAILQKADAEPRQIHWAGQNTAFIDRVGVRIALGFLAPTEADQYTHLVISVGQGPGALIDDGLLSVSNAHLIDHLVCRIKEDSAYDMIMRGETPEDVDDALILSLFDLLRQAGRAAPEAIPANLDAMPVGKNAPRIPAEERFDIILDDDVLDESNAVPSWVEQRAHPTPPLRLTVHTMALSVMLYTAPLGAFLFTYSMLRDVTGGASSPGNQL